MVREKIFKEGTRGKICMQLGVLTFSFVLFSSLLLTSCNKASSSSSSSSPDETSTESAIISISVKTSSSVNGNSISFAQSTDELNNVNAASISVEDPLTGVEFDCVGDVTTDTDGNADVNLGCIDESKRGNLIFTATKKDATTGATFQSKFLKSEEDTSVAITPQSNTLAAMITTKLEEQFSGLRDSIKTLDPEVAKGLLESVKAITSLFKELLATVTITPIPDVIEKTDSISVDEFKDDTLKVVAFARNKKKIDALMETLPADKKTAIDAENDTMATFSKEGIAKSEYNEEIKSKPIPPELAEEVHYPLHGGLDYPPNMPIGRGYVPEDNAENPFRVPAGARINGDQWHPGNTSVDMSNATGMRIAIEHGAWEIPAGNKNGLPSGFNVDARGEGRIGIPPGTTHPAGADFGAIAITNDTFLFDDTHKLNAVRQNYTFEKDASGEKFRYYPEPDEAEFDDGVAYPNPDKFVQPQKISKHIGSLPPAVVFDPTKFEDDFCPKDGFRQNFSDDFVYDAAFLNKVVACKNQGQGGTATFQLNQQDEGRVNAFVNGIEGVMKQGDDGFRIREEHQTYINQAIENNGYQRPPEFFDYVDRSSYDFGNDNLQGFDQTGNFGSDDIRNLISNTNKLLIDQIDQKLYNFNIFDVLDQFSPQIPDSRRQQLELLRQLFNNNGFNFDQALITFIQSENLGLLLQDIITYIDSDDFTANANSYADHRVNQDDLYRSDFGNGGNNNGPNNGNNGNNDEESDCIIEGFERNSPDASDLASSSETIAEYARFITEVEQLGTVNVVTFENLATGPISDVLEIEGTLKIELDNLSTDDGIGTGIYEEANTGDGFNLSAATGAKKHLRVYPNKYDRSGVKIYFDKPVKAFGFYTSGNEIHKRPIRILVHYFGQPHEDHQLGAGQPGVGGSQFQGIILKNECPVDYIEIVQPYNHETESKRDVFSIDDITVVFASDLSTESLLPDFKISDITIDRANGNNLIVTMKNEGGTAPSDTTGATFIQVYTKSGGLLHDFTYSWSTLDTTLKGFLTANGTGSINPIQLNSADVVVKACVDALQQVDEGETGPYDFADSDESNCSYNDVFASLGDENKPSFPDLTVRNVEISDNGIEFDVSNIGNQAVPQHINGAIEIQVFNERGHQQNRFDIQFYQTDRAFYAPSGNSTIQIGQPVPEGYTVEVCVNQDRRFFESDHSFESNCDKAFSEFSSERELPDFVISSVEHQGNSLTFYMSNIGSGQINQNDFYRGFTSITLLDSQFRELNRIIIPWNDFPNRDFLNPGAQTGYELNLLNYVSEQDLANLNINITIDSELQIEEDEEGNNTELVINSRPTGDLPDLTVEDITITNGVLNVTVSNIGDVDVDPNIHSATMIVVLDEFGHEKHRFNRIWSTLSDRAFLQAGGTSIMSPISNLDAKDSAYACVDIPDIGNVFESDENDTGQNENGNHNTNNCFFLDNNNLKETLDQGNQQGDQNQQQQGDQNQQQQGDQNQQQ